MTSAFAEGFLSFAVHFFKLCGLLGSEEFSNLFVVLLHRGFDFFDAAVLNGADFFEAFAEDRFDFFDLFRSERQALFHSLENVVLELFGRGGAFAFAALRGRCFGGLVGSSHTSAGDSAGQENKRDIKCYCRSSHWPTRVGSTVRFE